MTRFARAKGSKASNERVAEEATSWREMKQQLLNNNKEIEDNKKRQEIHNQRNANYKAFLKDREESESKKTSWADFDTGKSLNKIKTRVKNVEKSTCQSNGGSIDTNFSENEFNRLKKKVPAQDVAKENQIISGVQVKKSKRKKRQIIGDDLIEKTVCEQSTVLPRESSNADKPDSDSDAPPDEDTAKKEVIKPIIRVKKPKQKKLKIVIDGNNATNGLESNKQEISKSKNKKRKFTENGDNPLKKKMKKGDTENKDEVTSKRGNQKKKIIKENLTEKDLRKIEKKKQKRFRQVLKKQKIKAELKQQKTELKEGKEETSPNTSKNGDISEGNHPLNNSDVKKRNKESFDKRKSNSFDLKMKKTKNNDEHSRKKPFLPHKMFINGKELDIEYVDGFPVKKEDAERIKKLRREMISKGLPRSEINIALKLERRKAEKAFAREKKKVCYNCRKSGHNLSECPELNKDQIAQTAGSGICFKCGSTEHTHFECKVIRGQEFRFAQCFICNEQGHIARQCPDNARGLYPKGGACKVCGDVTHLKKDCPTYQAQQQKQEGNLNIETFGDGNPDILEGSGESNTKFTNKRPNKIIKF